MREFIRRSYLTVSPLSQAAVDDAWTHDADAVVLDLHDVPYQNKGRARPVLREQLPSLAKGGADAFVHISMAYLHADAEAAVWPGLNGILLSHPETALDVLEADAAVADMEKRHGVDTGSVEMVLLLGSAKGVWNIREVITASPRVTTVGLDDTSLLADLGILASPDLDPLASFARGRLVMEAAGVDENLHGHQGVYRLGIAYPLSAFPRPNASPDEVLQSAKIAKESVFNGALCPDPSWVGPCNRGFTPTDEQLAHHRKVQETYAAGLAIGRGAVPFGDGRFVERPFHELAKKIIALRTMCDERDAEKAAARATAGRSRPA